MKKKTTAKRGKKRKHKKSAVINNMMERGNNGKYDGLYNNSKELRTKRKPQDRTPTSPHIAQDLNRCAAAKFCACNNMPLLRNHRCVVCAFSVHPECGIELQVTAAHKIPATSISLVCKACAEGGGMMKFVQDGEISLRHCTLNKCLRRQYPLVQLISPEEELSTSSEESSSDSDEESEEDSEEQTKEKMEIDDEEEDTSAKPKNKAGDNNGKISNDNVESEGREDETMKMMQEEQTINKKIQIRKKCQMMMTNP